ncbi:F-box only protein 33 [Microtus ochrogaster]|uniref:F-box only protein 33 n=1 Tax=Microtus ochrogaster TaxID=79684 RepID=A0A8J6KXU1_MICOH|nr:F-box only protein 33 [Microtus ochrogaster]
MRERRQVSPLAGVPPRARCRGRTEPASGAAGPAPRPAGVLDHVPRDSGNQELPGPGSHARPRQAPPPAADVKLSPYHYRASASRSGESRGFLRDSAAASGPRVRRSEGSEIVQWTARGVLACGAEQRRLAGCRPPRPSSSPFPPPSPHLVPPKRTTVPPPSSLSLMLLFLSVLQSRPPGARTRAGAARVVRWRRRRQRLRLRLRQLRGLLRGLRGRPGASGRRRGRMALCGQAAGAASLPSELIVHIFSFLPPPDRLRASASCSHWRECLFYPALWPQLRLCLRVSPAEQPRLEFLMRKCGWFVRELRVEFAAENYLSGGGGPGDGGGGGGTDAGTGGEEGEALQLSSRWLEVLRIYLELVLCVLLSIRNNRNLQKFSLFGDISVVQQQGSLSSTYLSRVDPDGKKIKQIQQLFEEILINSRQLKWLSCGFMLEIITSTSLSSLSNSVASTMEHLSLLDNNIPGNSTLITAVELERFVNLRSLALDFCDFTADMARVLTDSNHVPLQRLSLLVHNVSVMYKSLDNMPNDEHWKALSRKSSSLRVYLMAFDVKGEDMLKILKPSIPLERVHFDSYVTCVSGSIVDLISRQYDKFLTHFILMNDVIDMSGFPDLSDNRNEDPLVLLAWRCTKLTLLAIHGYTVWAHNLIAIARLRGSDLKVLEVTEESIDFDQGELADQDVDPVHNLIEQVSLGLGQPWHAVLDIESLSVFTEPNRHFYREMQSFSEDI